MLTAFIITFVGMTVFFTIIATSVDKVPRHRRYERKSLPPVIVVRGLSFKVASKIDADRINLN